MRALVAPTVAEVVDFPLEALTDIRAEAVANIDAAMSMFFPGLANAA
ncbi:MAG: hypothetical protein KIT73_00780 [Burkholderiales bacterium]|nr:hypothetical protein [Burkholderiales bacterium]